MMQLLAVAGAALAVLGAGLMLVSEGARGLASGLLAVGLGLALALAGGQHLTSALLLGAAALGSAGLRLRVARSGWGLLPEGTSSRIVLWVVASAASLYLATSVLAGPAGELRAAALAVIVLTGARLLGTSSWVAALASVAGLALGIGTIGVAESGAILPAATAAAVALIAGWVAPMETARGA